MQNLRVWGRIKGMETEHFEALYPEQTREKEIKKIIEIVQSGRAAQVVGLPGSGKGIVMGLLAYNKNVRLRHLKDLYKWYHFVYMDFSEVKKRSFFDVVKFMLISLSYSLSERKLEEEQKEVNSLLKEALEFKDELILFQALKKAIDYLAIERKLTIIFLFDRFDQYTPFIDENFFLNLKILRNRAKYRFSAVFSSNRPLEEALEPSLFSEFYEFLIGNVVYLDPYDKAGTDFRYSYLEKVTGKKASEQLKQELVKITGGHGKLTRVCYELLLSEKNLKEGLETFLLDKTPVIGALTEIWENFTPEEQKLLQKNGQIDEKSYLFLSGIVNKKGPAIPLFIPFLKTLPSGENEKLLYNSELNQILQGNEDITDKLSPSEFKLLRFLILNKSKVCEKDEIIQNVWKDTKTQEGVTDQALDQIVYRLRKKIEADPNNPIYIQTVKGRGYKLN